MGRLTNGPLGAYTYGDGAHVHAMTQSWPYTASYDAAGNMICRSPSSNFYVGCVGQQTGALLSYNNEGQLSNWQNQPNSLTGTAAFLYDGQGNRVAQLSTQSGSTTTTVYLGNVEQDSTTGSTTAKTSYYYANGARVAMALNGVVSYLASDGLGSANVTLNASGNATASVLYAPYGSSRYSSGSMPTDYGFTGQHADSNTGLDYYNARYYDPTAGQFASADTAVPGNGLDVWGLSRYAYVEGNPIIRIDPSGHCVDYGAGHCYTKKQLDRMTTDSGDASESKSASGEPAANPSSNPDLSQGGDLLGITIGCVGGLCVPDPALTSSVPTNVVVAGKLPTGGEVPYESPDPSGRKAKLPNGNYRGKIGKRTVEWQWDSRKREWDVQLPGGGHLNVNEDGMITHMDQGTQNDPIWRDRIIETGPPVQLPKGVVLVIVIGVVIASDGLGAALIPLVAA